MAALSHVTHLCIGELSVLAHRSLLLFEVEVVDVCHISGIFIGCQNQTNCYIYNVSCIC